MSVQIGFSWNRPDVCYELWANEWTHHYPLIGFHMELWTPEQKRYQFAEHAPVKCFNDFVQSAVHARRQGDKNPNSNVVAETIKMFASSSHGYHNMELSRHSEREHLNGEKTYSAKKTLQGTSLHRYSTLWSGTGEVRDWTKTAKFCRFLFTLNFAKLRMVLFYYNFFTNFWKTERDRGGYTLSPFATRKKRFV